MIGYGMGGHSMRTSHYTGPKTLLRIEGMVCKNCKITVEKALNKIQGIQSVSVDLKRKEVVISGWVSKDVLIKAVEEAGYSVVR